jgi:hypothetical protein
MAKGIKRKLYKVYDNVSKEIADFSRNKDGQDGFYARGLASEGYNGGYRDAISDVLLALNGVNPNRRFWWED